MDDISNDMKTAAAERMRDPIIGPYASLLAVWNWKSLYLLASLRSEVGLKKAICWATRDPWNTVTAKGWIIAFGPPLGFLAMYWLYLWLVRPRVARWRAERDEEAKTQTALAHQNGKVPIARVELAELQTMAEAFDRMRSITVGSKRAARMEPMKRIGTGYMIAKGADLNGFVEWDQNSGTITPFTGGGTVGYVLEHIGSRWHLIALQGAVESTVHDAGQAIDASGRTFAAKEALDGRSCVAGWVPFSGAWALVGGATIQQLSRLSINDRDGFIAKGNIS